MLFCSLTAGGTQAQLMVLALALESGKFISIWDWQWYKMLCGDIFLPSVGSSRFWEKGTGGIVRCCFEVSDFWSLTIECSMVKAKQTPGVLSVGLSGLIFVSSTFSDIFFLKEFSETSSGQLNIKASALWARPNICWHLRVSHHALSVLSTEVLLKLFALPLKLFLCWDNPVCCRGGGFAFQKQFHVPKKSTR